MNHFLGGLNRRELLGLCAASVANALQRSPAGLLPVQGLDHVSLTVRDQQATVDFYRPILGQEIYLRTDTQSDFRISVGGVPYLAINRDPSIPSGTIDHFCIGIKGPIEPLQAAWQRAGLTLDGEYAVDPDGMRVQISESGVVNRARSVLRYPKVAGVAGLQPAFVAKGLDQVRVSVSNLPKAIGFYRMLCGTEIRQGSREVTFALGNSTVVLREVDAARHPGITDFRVLVQPFDVARATSQLKAVGVVLRTDRNGRFFVDCDGIVVYVYT